MPARATKAAPGRSRTDRPRLKVTDDDSRSARRQGEPTNSSLSPCHRPFILLSLHRDAAPLGMSRAVACITLLMSGSPNNPPRVRVPAASHRFDDGSPLVMRRDGVARKLRVESSPGRPVSCGLAPVTGSGCQRHVLQAPPSADSRSGVPAPIPVGNTSGLWIHPVGGASASSRQAASHVAVRPHLLAGPTSAGSERSRLTTRRLPRSPAGSSPRRCRDCLILARQRVCAYFLFACRLCQMTCRSSARHAEFRICYMSAGRKHKFGSGNCRGNCLAQRLYVVRRRGVFGLRADQDVGVLTPIVPVL